MAARFLNRLAGVGSAVGIGGFLVQKCIYDGACALLLASVSCLEAFRERYSD